MLDLLLFKLLRDGETRDERLPGLLTGLAKESLRERVPYLGYLLSIAADEAAETTLRRAAARCLTGATGLLSLELARTLCDHETLAVEGLDLLRSVSHEQPGRWFFVAFHANAYIRRAAYEGEVPPKAARFDLPLLADEVLRPFALQRLHAGNHLIDDNAAPLAIDLLRDGLLPADLCLRMLRRNGFQGLKSDLCKRRSDAAIEAYIKTGELGAAALEADDLDTVFEAMPGSVETWAALSKVLPERVATAAAVRIAAGDADERWRTALVLALPGSLATGRWSLADERIGLAKLRELGSGCPRVDGATLTRLLESRIVTNERGELNLGGATAVLLLAKEKPHSALLSALGAGRIARAMAADIEAGARLLSVPDGDTEARPAILAALPGEPEEATTTRRDLLIRFAEIAAIDELPFFVAQPGLLERMTRLLERPLADAERAQSLATLAQKPLGIALLSRALLPLLASASEESWLELRRRPLITAVLQAAGVALEATDFVDALERAPVLAILRVLGLLEESEPLSLAKELMLAAKLAGHPDATLAAWSSARTPAALEPLPSGAKAGVAFQAPPPAPSVERSVELFGSIDPPVNTDAAFLRFGSEEPAFALALDAAMAKSYAYQRDAIAALGHALLWRFEFHAFAHFDALLAEGPLAAGITARGALKSAALRRESQLAIAAALSMLSMRDKPRFAALVNDAVLEALVSLLEIDAAAGAAESLRAIAKSRVIDVSSILPRVRLALPDLSDDVRERLSPLADAKGLEPRSSMARPPPLTDEALREEARRTSDLDRLASFLDDERSELVHEATLRLILLGEPGCARLALALLSARPLVDAAPRSGSSFRAIIDSLPLWPDVPALEQTLDLVDDESARLELRFRVALASLERGRTAALPTAISILRRPTMERFFESVDWDRLVELAGGGEASFRLALALADSPHPRAHLRAVETLLAFPTLPSALDALRGFLECGSERMASLRRRAALALHEAGDLTGFPLVVSQLVDETKTTSRLFQHAPPDLVQATTRGFLAAGPSNQKESALLHHLRALKSRDSELAHELVLEHATLDKSRIAAATALSRGMSRERKLRRLIDVFLWGQRMGQRLLGKRMRVKMTGSKKLGFTRTQESVVYVTPLPMMRGDRFGREVVEALILHEIGHHMYHAGREADEVWKTAENEGIRGLFNLVADEHLERNLRAIEADYGDKLKRLAAYAFQHNSREIAIDTLLGHLGKHAHRVLTQTHVGLGRDDEHVAVESGALLFGMEKQGLAFARFARALRMGLGNRHADPIVDEALALFDKRFRHSTMDELLEISRKLKEIFGWETSLVESFGPHESLEGAEDGKGGDPESVIWGEGISQEEVDRVIERFTEKRASDPTAGGGGKLAINVNDDTQFAKITRIEAKPHDPDRHAPYRRKVEHPASVLRGYLEELGLAYHTEKMRLAGRRLDRARLLGLVTRGDPRVLTARKVVIERDLFLGIVIDCSGSMQSDSNIEKAKLFATLVTEAAAPLSSVDARIFGFTDQMIFDCGDAKRSGVAALVAGGGNNDAAALYHVAQVAKNSRRKAKVLIMISDGLPTECSVAALKNLVVQLTNREQMVLAQVAVQPISEVCFAHYVVLKDADITITVRKFGTVVASLVRRALGA